MQLSDYVLCFGEDGHVKFEFAVNGCCADTHSHDLDHPETSDIVDEDHCGECVDIPIFASINSEIYVVLIKENIPTDPSISNVTPISPKTTVPLNQNIRSFLAIPPLINPTLISLQTVKLLI